MVQRLEQIGAKVAKVAGIIREEAPQEFHPIMTRFYQLYTVGDNCDLEPHCSSDEIAFQSSQFRVILVNTFGSLLRLLYMVEVVVIRNEGVIAVDFEGMKLCRDGHLCIMQMTCSSDPTLVYVIDVYDLGQRCFEVRTPKGTSLKSMLEDPDLRKVWFDPRNDVDALYHQFGVLPRGIFDLQMAEVAERRGRGLNCRYVSGLQKCLLQSPNLQERQKSFATSLDKAAKRLFEPSCGGKYEVFRERPIDPCILLYAAHDARHMLMLHDQYTRTIDDRWLEKVLCASDERGRWCLKPEYEAPTSDVPSF